MSQYAPLVEQWLREYPDLAGSEVLRRLRLAGYGGGKSALYELVARLRVAGPRGISGTDPAYDVGRPAGGTANG